MRRIPVPLIALVAAVGIAAATPAAAQLPTLVPEACRGTATLSECGLNELILVFINVAQFIFGISGTAALAMFVWGGFLWLFSGGNAERIKQGQAVIVGAVTGLIIIFGAYVGVQFLVQALRGTVGAGDVLIAGEQCELSGEAGAQQGIVVATGRESAAATGGLECIAYDNCGALADLGYAEANLREVDAAAYDCVNGLMRSSPEHIKCCKLRSGGSPGTPAPGGAPGEGSAGRNNCTCADRGVTSVSSCSACQAFCTTRGSTMAEYGGTAMTSCAAATGTCRVTCVGSACRPAADAGTACTAEGGTFTAPGTCDFPMTRERCDATRSDPRFADAPDRDMTVTFIP